MQSTSATDSQVVPLPGSSNTDPSQPSIGEVLNTGTVLPSSSDNKLLAHEDSSPTFPCAENTQSQDLTEQPQEGDQAVPEFYDPLFDSPEITSPERRPSSSLPSHRARAANPLIKMVDEDPSFGPGVGSAISTKARLLAQNGMGVSGEGSSAGPASKPGPGRSSQGLQAKNRSSLLVFEKGSLKSLKGEV